MLKSDLSISHTLKRAAVPSWPRSVRNLAPPVPEERETWEVIGGCDPSPASYEDVLRPTPPAGAISITPPTFTTLNGALRFCRLESAKRVNGVIPPFVPTNVIFHPKRSIPVRMVENALYLENEWVACSIAEWEYDFRNHRLLYQGYVLSESWILVAYGSVIGSSETAQTIGLGLRRFVVNNIDGYYIGQRVRAVAYGMTDAWMEGRVDNRELFNRQVFIIMDQSMGNGRVASRWIMYDQAQRGGRLTTPQSRSYLDEVGAVDATTQLWDSVRIGD